MRRKSIQRKRHRGQISSVQKTYLAQTKNVTDVIEEHGNPFAEDTGKAQHQTFVVERLNSNIAAFNDTVHKNNLPLLTSKSGKKPTKSTSKICNLQNDVHLFSRMYISCQTRDSDMDAFFEHENHAWPPSLAANGIMHQTSKSDLIMWNAGSLWYRNLNLFQTLMSILLMVLLFFIYWIQRNHTSLSQNFP